MCKHPVLPQETGSCGSCGRQENKRGTMSKNIYLLMHKNIECCKFEVDGSDIKNVEIINEKHLPFNFFDTSHNKEINILNWFKNRSFPTDRIYYEYIIKNLQNISPLQMIILSKGLRVTDCYWIKENESSDNWEEVNFFTNDTNEILDRIYINSKEVINDLIIDKNTLKNPNITSGGSLPKVWKKINGKWLLYKDSIKYNETDNEILLSKILVFLNIKHIKYDKAKLKREIDGEIEEKTYCVCENYCNEQKEYIPMWEIQHLFKKRSDTTMVKLLEEYCEKVDIKNINSFLSEQIIIDYIFANSDRHWNNFGLIRNPNTLEFEEIMPIFDNGNSIWFNKNLDDTFNDPLTNFPYMNELKTTKYCLRYVTDWSLLENEKLYQIPDLIPKYRLETNKYYDERRIQKEVEVVTSHINYLKEIRIKGFGEVLRSENKFNK